MFKTRGNRFFILTIFILTTAFLGEMKVTPFLSPFRFSLGSAVFFFGLLCFQTIPPVLNGLCTGIFVTGFRVLIDILSLHMDMIDSVYTHIPSGCFYVSFGIFVQLVKLNKKMDSPLRAGLLGAAFDFSSNMVEISVRQIISEPFPITYQAIVMLMSFAVLRSFSVIGLYTIFILRHLQAIEKVRKQQLEQLVMINKSLYEETFYLKKSMSQMEEITRKSYQLYLLLKEGVKVEPTIALKIAKQMHEIKKDSQRIYAGLSKLIEEKYSEYRLPIHELCQMVIHANEKYASLLNKSIHFKKICEVNLSTNQVYPLLSVLNNLVANAVEAIQNTGEIELHTELIGQHLVFTVTDSGPGILDEDAEWVFALGFTTKYDQLGNPSTGIGLTHTRDIVESLNGSIQLISNKPGKTQFQVFIPTNQLLRKEDFQ